MTRDDLKWWAGILGGVLVAVSGHLDLFPWFSPVTQHWIEFAGFVAAIVSGKMATSPLPGKIE